MADFDFAKAAGDLIGEGPSPPSNGGFDFVGAAASLGSGQELTATPPSQAAKLGSHRADLFRRAPTVDSPNASASVGATLKSGFMGTTEKQIQAFARARGVPVERYGVDKEGNIGFLNDQGQWVREVPTLSESTGPVDFLRRLGAKAGSSVGEFLPQLGAAGVGVAMGPTGASIPAAAGTAGVLDVGRQALGNMMLDEPTLDINPWPVAGQAATAGIGQGLSFAINKLWNSNPLYADPREYTKLRDPNVIAAAETYTPAQTGFRTQVTPGEATGSWSLLQRQRQLGRDPMTADRLGEFYDARRGNVLADANDLLGGISPVTGSVEGAGMLRQGASAAVDTARSARQAASRPLYDATVNPSNVIPDATMAPLKADPFLADVFSQVKGNKLYGIPADMPEGAMPVVDLAKRHIDDMIEVAKRKGENNAVRLLMQKKNMLVGIADEAFPGYPAAREAFAGASPEVNKLAEGAVGAAARDVAVDRAGTAPRTLFNFSSIGDASEVRTAKAAFERAGRMDDWNAGLRTFLQDQLDQATKNDAGNLAKKFRDAVWQDPRAKAVLEEALPPGTLPQWRSFMDVLEKVAKQPAEGSPTATDLGAKPFETTGRKAVKVAGNILSPQTIGERLRDWAANAQWGSDAPKVLDALLDPKAIPKLKQLQMLSPTSQKALTIVDGLLVNAGVYGAMPAPDERVPADLSTVAR